MRICHVGHFDPDYSRNRIVAQALTRAGAEVTQVTDGRTLLRRAVGITRGMLNDRFDLYMVGFPGHADVMMARLAATWPRRPVVFDALTSLYESATSEWSVRSRWKLKRLHHQDRLACQLADLILLDTEAHISYFIDEFGLSPERFRRLWVGSEDPAPAPSRQAPGPGFTVLFYGSYNPLHGAEVIVESARRLEDSGEDISVVMVGDGQTRTATENAARVLQTQSVRFVAPLPYSELRSLVAEADLCLGIFGTTPKAARVIPNKVFDALALGRPVVTGDTPAARECLTHAVNAWLCPVGDPRSLAEAILLLKRDESLRRRIGRAGRELFREHLSIDALTADIASVVQELVPTRQHPTCLTTPRAETRAISRGVRKRAVRE